MPIKLIKDHAKLAQEIKQLTESPGDYQAQVEETVTQIIDEVRRRGDKALLEYTRQFDHHALSDAKQLRISQDKLVDAWEQIGDELREALQLAKNRISHFCERQKLESWQMTEADGSILGQIVRPLDSAGLYVPGGTAAYPSSVLMNVIPAKIAGVARVVVVSPMPSGELNPLVLAAAFLCEVDEFYCVGGAQAVAALAYGTETIAPVDKIVGPGNIYVASAKRQVFGKVAIDMIAGPSEVTVVSDGSADPEWIIADLFAQAEHDTNAQSLLITTSEEEAKRIQTLIPVMLEKMPRHEIITKALATRGAIIVVPDLIRAAEVVNWIAPEHLELVTTDNDSLLGNIRHAGAIFVGAHSCEALGDYVAGPNHVLPTAGSARFSSGLGVYDFQKRSSLVQLSEDKSRELAKPAHTLATQEGLFAHALAAKLRENATNS